MAKKGKKIVGKIFLGLLIAIVIIAVVTAIVNTIGNSSNKKFIKNSIAPVEYENQLKPEQDEAGISTFVTDENFRLMQLTDVHIGGGWMSNGKDKKAIDTVSAMVSAEKPDLIIVTGDIAYPVPFQAGTFNNKSGAVIFAELMEKLGVYWAPCFGNHDTEAYSYYSRKSISKLYENREKYPHCLFAAGPEDVDGFGNYVINVKKSDGTITKSFFIFDSHSYVDKDYFGALWRYDCVHTNQVQWYYDTLHVLQDENNDVMPKSLAFMHIPPIEMKQAFNNYRDNGYKNTDNVRYIAGNAGEHKDVVFSGEKNNGIVNAFQQSKSTSAVFFGHDHLNNFSLSYNGIRLCYGYSVDYLAYSGISKYGAQRGCQMITIQPSGSYMTMLENFYQDKYTEFRQLKDEEEINMGNYYGDEEAIHMVPLTTSLAENE